MIRAVLLFMVFQLVMFPIQVSAKHTPSTTTIFEKNSLYQFIRVEEDRSRGERYIIADDRRNLSQGGIYIDDPEKLLFEYTQLSFVSLAYLDREPKDVLFVGLGAGVMPRYLEKYYKSTYIDAVEIDPEMLAIAKKYFHFVEKDNLNVHISDGRVFVKRTKKKYDMIFLDAYKGDNIPFHLTTMEFLKEVKRKLKKGGVVVSNILSENTNKYFWSMVKIYKKEFPNLYVYQGESSNNFVFVASRNIEKEDENVILARAQSIQSAKGLDINLQRQLWDFGDYQKYEAAADLLTDDFAPVNLLKYKRVDQ